MFDANPTTRTAIKSQQLNFSKVLRPSGAPPFPPKQPFSNTTCFFQESRGSYSPRIQALVWPAPSKSFCIIHHNEAAFMAQIKKSLPVTTNSVSTATSPAAVARVKFKAKCSTGIVSGNLLLCLQLPSLGKHPRLVAYELQLDGDRWSIRDEEHVLAKIDRKVDASAGIAALEVNGQWQIVVLREDQKLEWYRQSPDKGKGKV